MFHRYQQLLPPITFDNMLSRFCLEKYNNNMFTHCGTVLRRRSFCSKSNKTKKKKKSWLCYDLSNTLRFIQAINSEYVIMIKKKNSQFLAQETTFRQ